uniref:HTH CENPB-type domain-containing protein n=1 Tax=Gopherus agassizii TaxID=38772 RepID=A0A452GLB2_9SAUR
MNNGEIKRKRSAYHTAFKLKVVEYAEANNNCAAACEICINEKQVREWRKNKTLKDMPRSKKKCPTRCASFPELEKDLNNWVVECRQHGYIVTRTGIRLHALQMSKGDKYKSVKLLMFVASVGWCTRFMNHHGRNLMKPDINLVSQWIKYAWVSIRSEMIEKSFRKCCISNVVYWSEDDAIFDDDSTEVDDEKGSESEDDTADIYDDNASAAVTEAEFNELFGESETDSDIEGF